MNCGCEYTHFPLFLNLKPYSRFDHSFGVALIVWHFTGSVEQSLAGLFHDVTIPVFAHVVDFLNGDHLRQESTEAGVAECLAGSPEVCRYMEKYGVTLEQCSDYHRYPIADNASPALSADRLEYTLGNLLNYHFAERNQIQQFYEDLIIGKDQQGNPELVFRTMRTAVEFTKASFNNSRVYVADEDRFAMQKLADLLRLAIEQNVLTIGDLQTTEPIVIEKLKRDLTCQRIWHQFCDYSRILRFREKQKDDHAVCVDAKKRWIDPMVLGKGRVSQWNDDVSREIQDFCNLDFSDWLRAE